MALIYKVFFFGRRKLVQAAVVQRIEEIAASYAGIARETADPSTAVHFSTSPVEISV